MDMDELRDDIFNAWKGSIYENYGSGVYLYKGRKEPIEDLVNNLIEMKISYESAKLLQFKMKTALVTQKGLKEVDKKYKGWKDTVESDFLRILFDIYKERGLISVPEQDPVGSMLPVNKNQSSPILVSPGVFEQHPLIEIWGQKAFGSIWCEELSLLAHTKDSSLHNRFLDEWFG